MFFQHEIFKVQCVYCCSLGHNFIHIPSKCSLKCLISADTLGAHETHKVLWECKSYLMFSRVKEESLLSPTSSSQLYWKLMLNSFKALRMMRTQRLAGRERGSSRQTADWPGALCVCLTLVHLLLCVAPRQRHERKSRRQRGKEDGKKI